jgi:hypothetical protein
MENKETTYEYEMFFDSKEDEPVKIHGWYPIATDRIRNPEKIEDYIKSGLLRKLEKPIVEEKQTDNKSLIENPAIRLNRIAKEINNPIINWGVGFTAEVMYDYAKEYANIEKQEQASSIINYIENDAEIAIPIELFFDATGNHITKKEYGKILIKILCDELRERFTK